MNQNSNNLRPRRPRKNVVTHPGKHHFDEILAVAILQLYYGKDSISVIRSREKSVLDSADLVVDVGKVYAPEKGRFDHHQLDDDRLSRGVYRQGGYAAAGLVWRRFGRGILRRRTSMAFATGRNNCHPRILDQEVVRKIVSKTFHVLDNLVMRPVDEWDNGYHRQVNDIVPAQHIIASLDFQDALKAARVFLQSSIKRILRYEAVKASLAETLNYPGQPALWEVAPNVLVLVGTDTVRPATGMAETLIRERYPGSELVGLISKEFSRDVWVLLLHNCRIDPRSLSKSYPDLQFHPSGRVAHGPSAESLLAAIRFAASTSGGVTRVRR